MTIPLQVVTTRTQDLAEREALIEENSRTFAVVGRELRVIRDTRLYREQYESFDDYLRTRWAGLGSRAYANRVIAATAVLENLAPMGARLPLTERQARPLTQLTPDDQITVWERVLEAAATIQVTEKLVAQIVEAFLAERVRGDDDDAPDELAAPFYFVDAWNRLPEAERRRIIAEAPAASDTRFNRTNGNVEWALWTWNPVTGCDHGCDYCYARDLAQRYYTELPEGERFAPVFRPSRLHAPRHTDVPVAYDQLDPVTIGEKNVFVCSMADLFGKWVPQDWIDAVFAEVVGSPEWNYLFLTKFPQRLAEQRWPENAWVGTTVDRQTRVGTAEKSFRGVTAGVKWLSCEPLLERLTFSSLEMFDWVVIGASSRSSQTPEFQPPWEWVEHLISQARAAGCRVYVKPNLKSRPREYPVEVPAGDGQ